MKVYDQTLSSTASSSSMPAREAQRAGRTDSERSGSSSPGGDRIEFSGALGTLSRALAAFGADRSSRVQALSAKFQSGTYHPDAAATSRGMVAEALASAAK